MAFGVELPEHIGVYAVERELGAGGMGMVYLARSRGGRAVAVKVARPELAADPHFRQRFRAEVDAARKVGGFHTAPVVDADPDAEAPWLATAYIPGPTLSGLLADQGPMGGHQLRLLGAALAEALQAIHACGLVHRDLKPANIIMAEDGPRVLDFGIARAVESTRLTSTGTAFGTPGFLAPEQAQGLEVGGAADVFALGAVLVSAAGGSAFGAGTPMGLMYRSVHEPADLSAVPQDLRPVVAACLSKDPAHRPTPDRLLDLFAPGSDPSTPTLAAPAEHVPTTPLVSGDRAEKGGGPASTEIAFTAPPTPAGRSRRRMVSVALAVTVGIGALVGGTVYLATKDDTPGRPPASAPQSPQSPRASSADPAPTPADSPTADSPKDKDKGGDRDRDKVTVLISHKGPDSWISAKESHGRLLFDGMLHQGETKTFTDKERIDLVLGDASAVQLVVNGKKIERGQPGQVERLTYTKRY
ncbi:RodZ domain-containing protein [Streptomyces sp. NPDC048442]|uniref:RodZ domain-containing protein n=1 Tax=Streptomyces sp. NPDC048442 TaxID=3154823 RepID=UPI00342476B9